MNVFNCSRLSGPRGPFRLHSKVKPGCNAPAQTATPDPDPQHNAGCERAPWGRAANLALEKLSDQFLLSYGLTLGTTPRAEGSGVPNMGLSPLWFLNRHKVPKEEAQGQTPALPQAPGPSGRYLRRLRCVCPAAAALGKENKPFICKQSRGMGPGRGGSTHVVQADTALRSSSPLWCWASSHSSSCGGTRCRWGSL